MKIPKEIFEEWSQKLIATISTISVIMSASMNKLYSKDVIEEIIDVEQIDVEMVLKIDLQLTDQEKTWKKLFY